MQQFQVILSILLASVFPTVTVLVGLIMNRRNIHDLRADYDARLSEVKEELSGVRERIARLEVIRP